MDAVSQGVRAQAHVCQLTEVFAYPIRQPSSSSTHMYLWPHTHTLRPFLSDSKPYPVDPGRNPVAPHSVPSGPTIEPKEALGKVQKRCQTALMVAIGSEEGRMSHAVSRNVLFSLFACCSQNTNEVMEWNDTLSLFLSLLFAQSVSMFILLSRLISLAQMTLEFLDNDEKHQSQFIRCAIRQTLP